MRFIKFVVALNSNLGAIYTAEVNFVNPKGQWAGGATLTLDAGIYIVLRRGFPVDGSSTILFGAGYDVGSFGEGRHVEYVQILQINETTTITNFAFGSTDIMNGITAICLK